MESYIELPRNDAEFQIRWKHSCDVTRDPDKLGLGVLLVYHNGLNINEIHEKQKIFEMNLSEGKILEHLNDFLEKGYVIKKDEKYHRTAPLKDAFRRIYYDDIPDF